MNTFTADPKTKQDWHEVLDYLYSMWCKARLPVTHYKPAYARGALRLDGVIGGRQIGRIVH